MKKVQKIASKALKQIKAVAQAPKRTRRTSVQVAIPMSFKEIGDQYDIPAPTIAARYDRLKAQNPRKTPTIEDLVQYQRAKRS